jgi:hypothetical protein
MSSILPAQAFLDRTDPNPLVIYHGNCTDGFGAALVAWLCFQGRGEYVAMDFGKPPPDATGRSVYILDFSFSPEVLRQLDQQAKGLVLLDHHASAQKALAGFQCRCGTVHFDMTRSGTQLAWDFFQPDQPAPPLVRFIQDRDLWRWEFSQRTRYFCAALDMEPMDFVRWKEIASFDEQQVEAYIASGRSMDTKFMSLVQNIAREAKPVTVMGQAGLMCNAPGVFHSDLGNLLASQCGTFALLWYVKGSGSVKVGLRSMPAFDTLPLATAFGGGGHKNASGFKLEAGQLGQLLSGILDALQTS